MSRRIWNKKKGFEENVICSVFETKIVPIRPLLFWYIREIGDDRKRCVVSTLLQVQKRTMTLAKHFRKDAHA